MNTVTAPPHRPPKTVSDRIQRVQLRLCCPSPKMRHSQLPATSAVDSCRCQDVERNEYNAAHRGNGGSCVYQAPGCAWRPSGIARRLRRAGGVPQDAPHLVAKLCSVLHGHFPEPQNAAKTHRVDHGTDETFCREPEGRAATSMSGPGGIKLYHRFR